LYRDLLSTMASALRAMLLRQALAAPSKRAFTTTTLPAFRSQLLRRPALQQSILQRAAFQTTAHRALLPPLPQSIEGTVNDAAKVPTPDETHGSYHWTAERLISAAILPITVAPFAAGSLNPLMDGLFIGLILIHSHIGFQSVITDYLPKWRVPRARKLFDWLANLALVVVGWGWYEFETNDVGLTEGIRRLWKA